MERPGRQRSRCLRSLMNPRYQTVLSFGAIHYAVQGGSNFTF